MIDLSGKPVLTPSCLRVLSLPCASAVLGSAEPASNTDFAIRVFTS